MKLLLPILFLLFSDVALAHPGHGREGLLHFHEFSDGLLIVAGLAAAALVYLARKK